MKTLLISFLLLLTSISYAGNCSWNYQLNQYQYNCEIKYGPHIFQFSSECYCHKTVDQRAHSPEGPIRNVSNMTCQKASIHNNAQKTSKYHNFEVRTFLKGVPIRQEFVNKFKYVSAKKNICRQE